MFFKWLNYFDNTKIEIIWYYAKHNTIYFLVAANE